MKENKLYMNINRKQHGSDIYVMELLIKLKDMAVAEPYNPNGGFQGRARITELRLEEKQGNSEIWNETFNVTANRANEDGIRVNLALPETVSANESSVERERDTNGANQSQAEAEAEAAPQTTAFMGELGGDDNGGTSGSYEP